MLIKDICSSLTDGSHNPPQGISESSFLMLSSKNVFDDNITLDEPRFLSKEDFEKENKRTNIKTGDILLTIVGTVGRAAVVTADLPPFTLQRSVAVLHPNIEVCNGRYLMYALQGRRSYIENRAKGVAQKGIYLKDVAKIDIPVPSKEAQNQIVAKLDKVNSIIKYRRKELLKLDELVKARFVELFGDPNYNDKGWILGVINDIGTCVAGATPSTKVKEYWENGTIPWMSSGEVNKGRVFETDTKITQFGYDNASTKLVPPKTVVLAMAGQGKTRGTAAITEIELCTNQSICSIVNNKKINAEYLLIFLKMQYKELRRASTNTDGRGGLNLKIIGNYPIMLPPIELQNDFVDFVEQVDKSKAVVQKALDEEQTLFDSLMQEYFG